MTHLNLNSFNLDTDFNLNLDFAFKSNLKDNNSITDNIHSHNFNTDFANKLNLKDNNPIPDNIHSHNFNTDITINNQHSIIVYNKDNFINFNHYFTIVCDIIKKEYIQDFNLLVKTIIIFILNTTFKFNNQKFNFSQVNFNNFYLNNLNYIIIDKNIISININNAFNTSKSVIFDNIFHSVSIFIVNKIITLNISFNYPNDLIPLNNYTFDNNYIPDDDDDIDNHDFHPYMSRSITPSSSYLQPISLNNNNICIGKFPNGKPCTHAKKNGSNFCGYHRKQEKK